MRPDYPTERATINAVATKLGIGTAETLRTWVRQAQIDEGNRPGRTTDESAEQTRLLQHDVVLMDIRMPGGNGIDAARAIADALG
ncbi:hypothetical protein [Nonomuraea ceibae]|uniref:hypothetical protein n=1 Tax=Nonomuraea ceibae TaxID=1935170 RepID=UPI0035577B2A